MIGTTEAAKRSTISPARFRVLIAQGRILPKPERVGNGYVIDEKFIIKKAGRERPGKCKMA